MISKFKARKLGQNFLISREIAINEAEHANEKTVLEIGPGHGILTRELCTRAKEVIAVEKDGLLYSELKRSLDFENLKLIHADFLELGEELDPEGIDIVIANIPYNISSEVINWLSENGKEAVLCLQKEFVERMLAQEGTRQYSKLSVFSALSFSITEIMVVPRGNFSPVPAIDSEIIYMKPRKARIGEKEAGVIGALMQHKKRTVRKALIDSRAYFNSSKEEMDGIAKMTGCAEKRVFMLDPKKLLELSEKIIGYKKTKGS
jgi:16S rRNA (adenine1518-N6/adenine1519-N6)-dimethyltransferase